jgi:hypothetical protein
MIELSTLQAVSYIMGSLGVFIAAVYYVSTLRVQQRNMRTTLETRQAQLFMGIYQTYVTKELHRDIEAVLNAQFVDFEEWLSKYGPKSNPDGHAKFDSILSYMEGLGCLVKRGLIDPSYVVELLGLEVLYTHQKYQHVITGLRKASPTLYEDFDVLYEAVRKFIPEPKLEDRHMVN